MISRAAGIFNPEIVTSYDLGMKSAWLHNRLRFNARYTVPAFSGSLTLSGNLAYTGNRYYDERQLTDISSEGADMNVDAKISWLAPSQKFSASLWVRNLTDETTIIDVVDVGLFGYQNVWYNTPRTWLGVETQERRSGQGRGVAPTPAGVRPGLSRRHGR
jgi:hypothetical protein